MADDEDEMTNCLLCFEAYEEDGEHVPRMLPCHHTMCERCVADLLRGKTFVICPECRQKFHALNGVKTFSQNKYIVLHIQKEKRKQIERDESQLKNPVEISSEQCSVHNRVANIYCVQKTCEQPICPWCLTADHKDHKFEDLQELKAKMYERLMTKLESLAEDLLERRQKLKAKHVDVGKTIAEFNLNLNPQRIRPDLMYDTLRTQMANQMTTLILQITENMRVIEDQIDLVKNTRETIVTTKTTLKDITDKLRATENINPQICDKLRRKKKSGKKKRGSERREVILEEVENIPPLVVSGINVQEENVETSVKCTGMVKQVSL